MKMTLIVFLFGALLIFPLASANTPDYPDTAPNESSASNETTENLNSGMDVVTWTTGANMPTARYSSVTGFAYGLLHVSHGRISNTSPYNTNVLEIYDPVNNTWTTGPPAPTARRMVGMGQVQTGDLLYSVGGRDNSSVTVGTLEAYDMGGGYWLTTALPPCTPRWAHGAATEGADLYVFGGSNYTTSVEKYVFGLGWSTMAPLPVGVGWCAGASLNGKVYCLGGQRSTGPTAACYEYDPTTNTWTSIADMPGDRKYHTAVGDPITGRVFVFGGDVAGATTASVISYHPGMDMWFEEGDMPGLRIWSACGTNLMGEIYVLGGSTSSASANYQNNTWLGVWSPDLIIDLTYVSGSPVPASGGNLVFDVYLAHVGAAPLNFDAWLDIALVGGTATTVVQRYFTNYLPGWAINRPGMFFPIPSTYAAGSYNFYGRAGIHPTWIWAQDSFPFTKSGTDYDQNFVPFAVDGAPNPFDEIVAQPAVMPVSHSLIEVSPNPFNSATLISYQLPTNSLVNLAVYDLSGRKVADLVNGWRQAGRHEVTFDASHLASGVYLYQLDTDAQSLSGKMVYVK